MDEIKSAAEIAMEKAEKLGEATDEERLGWKYVPEGRKLAAEYIKQGGNLVLELSKCEDSVKKYIMRGAAEVLVGNISLPDNDIARKNNKRAMDGLKVVKSDKAGVENVYSKIRRIFDHYAGEGEQQKRQAYQSLKADFEAKMRQALQQQFGSFMGTKIDVERQPQFQEEWRKVQAQLDSQYLALLGEYKHELSAIS
jgi:hypothetical protein